jgi:hypothetical protein
VDGIKIRRLGWVGHIVNMGDERISKKIHSGKFRNTRSVAKPRTRWKDVVQRNELQALGIRGWRRLAGDREEWRRRWREAGAQKGI